MSQDYYYNDIEKNDLLVDTIESVLEGKAAFDTLMKAIEERYAQVRKLRDGFNHSVSLEEPLVRDLCRESIRNVEFCFNEFFNALDDLSSHVANFDKSTFQEEAERIEEACDSLNLSFLGYRNDVLIARGPTTHGGINLLINDILRLSYNEPVEDELRRDLEMEKNMAADFLAMLEGEESNFFNEGLRSFYTGYLGALKKFDGFFQRGNTLDKLHAELAALEESGLVAENPAGEMTAEEEEKLILEKQARREEIEKKIEAAEKEMDNSLTGLYKELEQLGELHKRYDIDYHIVSFSYEPTKLPMVNLVVTTGQKYLEGEAEKGMFQYFLDELWQLFDSVRFRYEAASMASTPNGKREEDEAAALDETLDYMTQSLDILYQFLESDNREQFETAINMLVESCDAFAASMDALQELSESGGKVTCFRCGFKNSPERMICANCNATLPITDRSTTVSSISIKEGQEISVTGLSGEPQMTAYIKKLFDTARGRIEGIVEFERFDNMLNEMDTRLINAEKAIKDIPAVSKEAAKELGEEKADEIQQLLKEAQADYREGLESFARGLDLFRDFNEAVTVDSFEKAKQTLWDGAVKLQSSQRTIEKEFKKQPA